MNETKLPHIIIPRLQMSSFDWCVNYAGMMDRGEPKTHCDAGVEYATVENQVAHTYQNTNKGHIYEGKRAHPCFKSQSHLAKPCAKCRFMTEPEMVAALEESMGGVRRMMVARDAILDELRRRWKEAAISDGVTAPANIDRFHKPQKNYFCGAGVMDCPICKTGKLKYSRSNYNGHVHAKCSTPDCVAWIE